MKKHQKGPKIAEGGGPLTSLIVMPTMYILIGLDFDITPMANAF